DLLLASPDPWCQDGLRMRPVPESSLMSPMDPADALPAITDACRLMASGALSPGELLDRCIGSIEATEPRIRAWVTLDLDGAREHVRRLGGRPPDDAPLWGIPV